MDDDTSEAAKVCEDWGVDEGVTNVGKWSDSGTARNENRLYQYIVFVWNKYHWLIALEDGREECDDDVHGGVSSGDFWKIYVR